MLSPHWPRPGCDRPSSSLSQSHPPRSERSGASHRIRTEADDKVKGSAKDRLLPILAFDALLLAVHGLLRATLGFKGTDTHGIKAFRRAALLDTVRACLVDKDVFASELVIRAERAGIRICEVPIKLAEIRPPSVNLWKRVPNVIKNVGKLVVAIRIRG